MAQLKPTKGWQPEIVYNATAPSLRKWCLSCFGSGHYYCHAEGATAFAHARGWICNAWEAGRLAEELEAAVQGIRISEEDIADDL